MIDTIDHLPAESLSKAIIRTKYEIPYLTTMAQAGGFPSPAENYIERRLDLNELCVAHQEATYFVRVTGDSMTGDYIFPGNVLVIDSARTNYDRKIIVAWYDGGYMVKRLTYAGKLVVLESSNPNYLPIYVQPGEMFKVLGVVTHNVQTVH